MAMCVKRMVAWVTIGFGLIGMAVGIFVYSGSYNIGADDSHTRPVLLVLEALREHSVKEHAKDITVPDLSDETLILEGAGQYAAMCVNCHLMPGKNNSEIRVGLYPLPPNLAVMHVNAKEAFWVIKHGIKMSGMPAWGASHDDETIWSMVAFLQKLPDMSPAQYKDIVSKAPPDDDMDGMNPDTAVHSEPHH